MKYVVLGAAGQLGRDLCPRLLGEGEGEVVAWTRADADLAHPAALCAKVTAARPDVVVNCAAYNFVDKAESEPEQAFAVNAWGVKALAEICRELDCTLVQFSSDYVFGLEGDRRTPYAEDDAPGPLCVYGLSKLAGEYVVRAAAPRHFVIRTCGLYGVFGSGGKGGNFVETMLRLAGRGQPLRVVDDQVCTPSYTVDVATAAVALLQTRDYGVYHLVNGGACSWCEFARTIFELTNVSADVQAIPSTEWKAAAARPGYSTLASTKLPSLRPWRKALAAYLAERRARPGASTV